MPWPKSYGKKGKKSAPLCWLETKTLAWWLNMLADIQADKVIDVTPGSGTLALACLSLGIRYVGVASSEGHFNFLNNKLHRASVKYMVRPLEHPREFVVYREARTATLPSLDIFGFSFLLHFTLKIIPASDPNGRFVISLYTHLLDILGFSSIRTSWACVRTSWALHLLGLLGLRIC